MNNLLRNMILGVLVAGSCINVMGQVPQENTAITTSYEIQKSSTDYLEIGGQIYVPFRWLLNQVGIQELKWEDGKKDGNTKAYITIEAPAYFWNFYISMLTRGLTADEEGSSYMPLPDSLKGVVIKKEKQETHIENVASLNMRPLELTVTSEGYEIGGVIYNYKIIDGKLYIPVDKVATYLGIQDVKVDQVTNQATLEYIPQDKLQVNLAEQKAILEEKLQLKNPRDVLAVWIRGQQMRNGALQYAVLCNQLKEKVLPEVKMRGWVTGGSSPSLSGGKVTIKNEEKVDEDTIHYTVQYESMLQGKVFETLEQEVEIKAHTVEGEKYWCINSVTGDVGYYTFENVR